MCALRGAGRLPSERDFSALTTIDDIVNSAVLGFDIEVQGLDGFASPGGFDGLNGLLLGNLPALVLDIQGYLGGGLSAALGRSL